MGILYVSQWRKAVSVQQEQPDVAKDAPSEPDLVTDSFPEIDNPFDNAPKSIDVDEHSYFTYETIENVPQHEDNGNGKRRKQKQKTLGQDVMDAPVNVNALSADSDFDLRGAVIAMAILNNDYISNRY